MQTFLNKETSEEISPVFISILDSRIEQIEAITLPNDQHRKDIIHAIQKIPSFSRKLSSFLDYMIDYTYTLNFELTEKQNKLNEAAESVSSLKNESKGSNSPKVDERIKRISSILGVNEDSLEREVSNLKKKVQKLSKEKSKTSSLSTIINNDYQNALLALNCDEGELSSNIQSLINQNQKLRKKCKDLQDEKRMSPKQYKKDNDDFSFDGNFSMNSNSKFKAKSHNSDLSDLKAQFSQIESDLAKLKTQVQNKFTNLHNA